MEKEFKIQKVPFEKQVKLELFYDNQKLKKYYRADFICYDSILLEIKAVTHMPNAFTAQLNNYLKCTNKKLGILINFGAPSLVYKRILNANFKK